MKFTNQEVGVLQGSTQPFHIWSLDETNYVLATGRAAREVFPLSSDGLGARIIGTAFNCSGATTPWQTVLSAEENFQGSSSSYMGVQENLLPNGTQTEYLAGTSGQEFGPVGEKYGWIVEIDPALRGRRRENTPPSAASDTRTSPPRSPRPWDAFPATAIPACPNETGWPVRPPMVDR